MAEASGVVARACSISRASSPVGSSAGADTATSVGAGAPATWAVTDGKSLRDFKMFVFFMNQPITPSPDFAYYDD